MARLHDLIQQQHFASPAQEAVLNVLATHAWVMAELSAAMAPHGVTPAQYNVLRILRGRRPDPATCSYIAARLLDRTPDVTRLVDRLLKAGWVTRRRADYDRRVAEIAPTEAGLDLLARLDPDVSAALDRITNALSEAELATLSGLLEQLRAAQEA
jgi:DNA-binding MarR family transcriptional regulator